MSTGTLSAHQYYETGFKISYSTFWGTTSILFAQSIYTSPLPRNVSTIHRLCLPYRHAWSHRTSADLRSSERTQLNSPYDQTLYVPRQRRNSFHANDGKGQTLLHIFWPSSPPPWFRDCVLFVHTHVISWKTHQHLRRRRLTRYYPSSKKVSQFSFSYIIRLTFPKPRRPIPSYQK